MNTRFPTILLMLAAFAAPTLAAPMTADAFLTNLENPPPDPRDVAGFHAYLRDAMDTMVLYTKALEADGHAGIICVPTGREFDLNDLRAMVSAALDAKPDDADKPLPLVVIESFAEFYPWP